MKVCKKCGRILALSEFPMDGRSPCRRCRSVTRMAWRHKNAKQRKRERLYMRQWRSKNRGYTGRKTKQQYNPIAQKGYRAKYRSKPGIAEKEREYCREYYRQHREEILAKKKLAKLKKVAL